MNMSSKKQKTLRERIEEYLKIGSMTDMHESILRGFTVPEKKRINQVGSWEVEEEREREAEYNMRYLMKVIV